MQIPEARWIVAGTLLLFAVLIAVYVAFIFRNLALGISDSEESTDLLSNFRQMRDEGQLNDMEFSRLKEVMPEHPANPLGSAGVEIPADSANGATSKTEKKFLTLAEAQRRKQEASGLDTTGSDEASSES